MSGGIPRLAIRFPIFARARAPILAALLATLALSGCSLLRAPQAPAPIVDAAVETLDEDGLPIATPEPASEVEAPDDGASQRKPHREAPRPRVVKRPSPPPPPPPPPPAPPPLIQTRTIERNQVHSLLDSEVRRRDGKVIGRAVDMIADSAGKPNRMIVNLQGFMGIGDRKVSFPWRLFRFTPGGRSQPILLDVPAGELPPADRPKAVSLSGSSHADETPGLMPIVDADVQRGNGTEIGRVVDVLIDRDAQPQAVVLDLGGLVNPDRRTIAASWSALRFAPKDKSLRALLDLSDAQLKASPPYQADKPVIAVSPPAATPASSSTGANR
ncbi:PRC-barrel domain-containing protein [Burkholderia gladioli]|uniref:PRC-barrel domain-containing protein n=1 Tax=Burkholderia gladioli TaxID=28095 RepID=UPI0034DAE08E